MKMDSCDNCCVEPVVVRKRKSTSRITRDIARQMRWEEVRSRQRSTDNFKVEVDRGPGPGPQVLDSLLDIC